MDKTSMAYRCGYADASAIIKTSGRPIAEIIDLIDTRKSAALAKGSSYTAGVAQGLWDKLLERQAYLP